MPTSQARVRAYAALTAGLALTGGGCYDVPVTTLPDYLQPVAGARKVAARGDGHSVGVHYETTARYPAAELLAAIGRQIPAEWTPRMEDWLNPGIPTSHVRGWTEYVDATSSPESSVHAWSGEWQNAAGDILTYHLTYRSPGRRDAYEPLAVPASDTVVVLGSVISRARVEQLLASVPRGTGEINWPLLAAALVVLAIGVLLLARSRSNGRRTGVSDGHRGDPGPRT